MSITVAVTGMNACADNPDLGLAIACCLKQSFARLTPTLSGMGIRTFVPNSHQLALRSKDGLPELAKETRVASPKTQGIYQANFFHSYKTEDWQYPLMVKRLFCDAKIAYNADEAVAAFHCIAGEWDVPVLAQSWIGGEEINLAGVGDIEGGLAGAVMMKKCALTDKGKGWVGISIHDEELLASAHRFCAVTTWRGGLELEMLRDTQVGLHLIEITPRFPAWIYLSAGVGCNLPELLVRLALVEKLMPPAPTPVGVPFIRYAEEAIVSFADFENITVCGETLRTEGAFA